MGATDSALKCVRAGLCVTPISRHLRQSQYLPLASTVFKVKHNEVILVDHNGTQVVNVLVRTMNISSPLSLNNQTLKSYSQLQSVKNALDGKSGVTVEMLNNTRKTVYHYPVQLQPHEWTVLLLRPSH